MRFHVGFSFRLKHLKKLLIPILIGLATYFGISFFGFLQVNAMVNLDTSYNLTYSELEVLDTKIDDNLTYNDFFNHLNSLESSVNKLIILVSFYSSNDSLKVYQIRLYSVPIATASIPFTIYGNSSYPKGFYFSTSSSYRFRFYTFDLSSNTYTDILESSIYSNFYTCYTTSTCNSSNGNVFVSSYIYGDCGTTNFLNDDSYNCSIPYYTSSLSDKNFIFYSSGVPLYYTETSSNSDTNLFYKSVYINDTKLSDGDYIMTYKEYLDSIDTPPDEPPNEDTEHKGLFSKIYWFDDNSTSYGVLTSIYELLFLYCLTMILFRILTFLKNKRW